MIAAALECLGELRLQKEIEQVRADLSLQIEQLRGEANTEIEQLRGEVKTSIEQLRGELTAAIEHSRNTLLTWLIPLMFAKVGALAALVKMLCVRRMPAAAAPNRRSCNNLKGPSPARSLSLR